MKDKKHKYLEDLIEEYLELTEEQAEIPVAVNKVTAHYQDFSKKHNGTVISADEAQYAFKVYSQLKKYNDRKEEIAAELKEVEDLLRDFLQFFDGHKISYEKKDENKVKTIFLFSVENGMLRCDK
ncbi:MAG TPA: hypothetical protein VF623_08160 [Segetibacter sp.]|jgi:hypothetical protein